MTQPPVVDQAAGRYKVAALVQTAPNPSCQNPHVTRHAKHCSKVLQFNWKLFIVVETLDDNDPHVIAHVGPPVITYTRTASNTPTS